MSALSCKLDECTIDALKRLRVLFNNDIGFVDISEQDLLAEVWYQEANRGRYDLGADQVMIPVFVFHIYWNNRTYLIYHNGVYSYTIPEAGPSFYSDVVNRTLVEASEPRAKYSKK